MTRLWTDLRRALASAAPAAAVRALARAPTGGDSQPFWALVRLGLIGFLVLRAAFGAGALLLDVTPLCVASVASLLTYGMALALLEQRWLRALYAAVAGELTAHAALATALLGWDAGFHLQLPGLLPLVFLAPGSARTLRVAGALLVAAAYLGLHAIFHGREPLLAVEPGTIQAIARLNILCCFLIWGGIASWHADLVAQARAELERSATQDPLTGMWNRRRMDLELARDEARRGASGAADTAVVLCDIDHFKAINDAHGHAAGDEALLQVSEAIRGCLRAGDHVARWGGEEFLVLLERTSEHEAREVAERIRAAVAGVRLEFRGVEVRLSLTLGVALARRGESAADSIARADDALYAGKATGRNRVVRAA